MTCGYGDVARCIALDVEGRRGVTYGHLEIVTLALVTFYSDYYNIWTKLLTPTAFS